MKIRVSVKSRRLPEPEERRVWGEFPEEVAALGIVKKE